MVDTISHEKHLPDAKVLIPEVREVQRLRRWRFVWWALVILVVVSVVVVSVVEMSRAQKPHAATSTTSFDTSTWDPGAKSDHFYGPTEAAFVGSTVWITNVNGYVNELNSDTGRSIRVFKVKGMSAFDYGSIAANSKYVWVGDDNSGTISQFRTSNDALVRVLKPMTLSALSGELAACGGDLWVANHFSLIRFAGDTGRARRILNLNTEGVSDPSVLSVRGSRLWVGESDNGNAVVPVNCSTGAVGTVVSGPGSLTGESGLLPARNSLWDLASNFSGSDLELVRLSQKSGKQLSSTSEARFVSDSGPFAVGDDSLWDLNDETNEAAVINLSTHKLIRVIRWGNDLYETPTFVGISDGKAWVLLGSGNSIDVYNAATGKPIGTLGGVGSSPGCGCLD
jgi:hypothetical protein